jgi:hypothetical protein
MRRIMTPVTIANRTHSTLTIVGPAGGKLRDDLRIGLKLYVLIVGCG